MNTLKIKGGSSGAKLIGGFEPTAFQKAKKLIHKSDD
tara:strand:+ start:298 stop:408 length:111 start_codon:yes stop_codon:yes gene_type:complete